MLQKLRVLDLSRVLAGPLCSMMLGDLGARVIKVERPAGGDETRGWGPPFDERGESAYFLSVNRNKLSVGLDLALDSDTAFLRGLIAEADVVLDNFRSGTLERRGIDPAGMLSENPSLIWCTISGFGPQSERPGYDYVIQAESGWMAITGEADGEPIKTGVAFADVIAGKDAAIAILAALAARGLSGGPLSVADRRLSISLRDSATAALVNVAQNVLVSGKDAARWGNAHPNLVPYQLFHAADRPFVIAVGNDAQFHACAVALELPELAADSSVKSNAGRLAHRERLTSVIADRVRQDVAAAWIARLDQVGVPTGVVRTVREALADVSTSPLTGVAPSIPGSVRLPPPLLDEHGEHVRRSGWKAFDEMDRAARNQQASATATAEESEPRH